MALIASLVVNTPESMGLFCLI